MHYLRLKYVKNHVKSTLLCKIGFTLCKTGLSYFKANFTFMQHGMQHKIPGEKPGIFSRH